MKQLLSFMICVLFSASTCLAQNTLNLHQKNGGVVSYGFSERPVLTYVGANLHVSTASVSIDYPISELLKMTFTETESSIGEMRVEGSTEVCIYRLDGTLVRRFEADADITACIQTADLPTGTYLIQQGTISVKITKR